MTELPDNFLLSYIGFDSDGRPFIDIQIDREIVRRNILETELALQFDTSQRHCTGWIDFENRRQLPCPDSSTVESKYEQCVKCRNRTGFNPAFYNTTEISEQQQTINQNPHFVYLAYFRPGLIKVGISQESRGIRRLLEQGARAALKLATFPSATIARQYESRIAKLDSVVENVTSSRKMAALKETFSDEQAALELDELKKRIASSLNTTFDDSALVKTSKYYRCDHVDPGSLTIIKDQPTIIGHCRSIIGRTAIIEHQDRLLAYDLKYFVGYRATKAHEDASVELPSEQMTLF